MSKTEMFRKQHEEIVGIVAEIEVALNADKLATEAGAEKVRSSLSRLSGKLNIHLAMEDKSLYPSLIASDDAAVAAQATQFAAQMGDIADKFKDYAEKWMKNTIAQDPDGFIAETNAIFTVLSNRIVAEENDLYKLADAM